MPASPGVQRHVLGPATVDVSTLGGLPVLESLGRLAGQAQQFEMPAVLQALIDLPNQAALLGALSWAAVQPPAPAKSGAGGGSSTASSTTPVQGTEHGADADATATASADMTSTIRQAHGNALSALTLSLFGRLDELRPAECVVALLALSNHEVYRTQCSRVTLSTGTGNTANNTALLLPGQQLDHDVVPQLEALYKRLKDQLPLDRSPGHAGMQGPLSIRTAPDTVTPMQQQGDALFGLGSDGGAAASASRRASSQPKTPAGEGSMHQAHMQCGGLATAGSPRAATASFTPGSADFITVMPVLPLPSTAALLLAAPRLAYMDRAVVSMLARFAAAQLDTCTSGALQQNGMQPLCREPLVFACMPLIFVSISC